MIILPVDNNYEEVMSIILIISISMNDRGDSDGDDISFQ